VRSSPTGEKYHCVECQSVLLHRDNCFDGQAAFGYTCVTSGRGAVRLARLIWVQEVGGSNPLAPTGVRWVQEVGGFPPIAGLSLVANPLAPTGVRWVQEVGGFPPMAGLSLVANPLAPTGVRWVQEVGGFPPIAGLSLVANPLAPTGVRWVGECSVVSGDLHWLQIYSPWLDAGVAQG
jgi:hypothetical protein